MSDPKTPTPPDAEGEAFARAAAEARPGFFADLWAYLKQHKKWWLIPLLLVLLLVGGLLLLSSSALAPFLYPLF